MGYVQLQQDILQACGMWPREAYWLFTWSLLTTHQHRICGILCCAPATAVAESRLTADEFEVAMAWLVEEGHWQVEWPYIWVIKKAMFELYQSDGCKPNPNMVTAARNELLDPKSSVPESIARRFWERYEAVLGPPPEGLWKGSEGACEGGPSDSEAEGRGRSSPNPKGEKKSPPRSPNLPAEAGKKQPKPVESEARRADPCGPTKAGKTGASNKSPPELARIWANQMLHAVKELCTEEYIKGNRGDARKLEDLGLDVEKWEKLVFKGNQKELVKAWRQAIDAGEARGD